MDRGTAAFEELKYFQLLVGVSNCIVTPSKEIDQSVFKPDKDLADPYQASEKES